jgi:hypothetical protein
MYDAEDESGNGFVTTQVGGIGTIAGPPARAMMSCEPAGRAAATDKVPNIQNMPIAAGGNMLEE